jgi:hypothetical protein
VGNELRWALDASGPRLTDATSTEPPNKGMKLTKPGELRSFAADMARPVSIP